MKQSYVKTDTVHDTAAKLFRLLVDALFVVILCMTAYRRISLESLAGMAEQLPTEKKQLLLAGMVFAGILTLLIVYAVHTGLNRVIPQAVGRICSNRIGKSVLHVAVVLFVLSELYWSLEISSFSVVVPFLHGGFAAYICNVGLLLLAELVLFLLLGDTKRSLTVLSTLVMLWSVANYYTVLYHGSPLIFSEFLNFKTAMAVAGSYSYRITREIIIIVFLTTLGLYVVDAAKPALAWDYDRLKSSGFALAMLVVTGFFVKWLYPRVVADDLFWMPWHAQVMHNGFLVFSVEDLQRRSTEIIKPDGYDESKLPELNVFDTSVKNEDYPDIVLILNESFCDLGIYTELTTDVPALETFYSIPCLARGFAIAPGVGGGTNDAEFELLTSKSNYLLTQGAPFAWMGKELLSRSVVSYLQSLGYETTGMHVNETNYNRNNAYPAMGFDHVLLGNALSNSEGSGYGNRMFPDAPLYEDLKQHTTEVDPARPQFYYLLTYQNHGGYEQNIASLDMVHVQNDFGDLTDDVNEYLSSLRQSAEAFQSMTEYYAAIERKIIICMVGDHVPPFIESLPAKDPGRTAKEDQITLRMIPYVIWTNYDAEATNQYTEYASMVDLVPMVLDIAGLPLSTFYSQILNLHEELPVRTRNGVLMDRNGNTFIYPQDSGDWSGLLEQYYYMEYNSLLSEKEYREELFLPVSGDPGRDITSLQ